MSRKLSLRLPDPLWAWLTARAGNRPVSAAMVDCLNQIRKGSAKQTKLWLLGAVIVAVGLAALYFRVAQRAMRKREPEMRESF